MIERMNISGTERELIHSFNNLCTVTLALDYDDGTLYWSDQCQYRLERSNVDGKSRMVIGNNIHWCFGMTVFQEYVYWTQGDPIGLVRKKKSGIGQAEMISRGNSITRYFGVVVVHPLRQPLPPGM